ncbi:glycoside hydrolase family 16 protein [Comamonas sp. JC664]|uniref:glycoside hydrolase family 16 protein n=1 Tax=Comamonas sp. JC664 TaxID=2801917 RepID=UPI001748D395|nr:glycoside hydrolase family 16 protein [Comamonas sp. JC664]MBL0694822.1 glycoside hydrolase family 16 protein [Comamonas sp. JC664]GHG94771.1 glycosyl hydrolase family 16 [Comamonas sp. KCTC 72670]
MTLPRLLPVAVALMGLACDPAANRVNRPNTPPPTPHQPNTDWELVWQDEFEGEAGTPPSPDRWVHDVGGHGWGNEQLEFNTNRTENAAHDGEGHLVLTARRERYGNRDYTSARIRTQGRYEPLYGRIEARIQLPVGRGIWPAFWMLGANIAAVDWPECGEIDIMEYRGQLPSILRGSLHGPGYSAGNNIGQEHVVSGKRLNEGFHIYAVEWEPDRIRWFLDDTMYFEATPAKLPAGARWVFDSPQFIILNVAVGGTFVGPVGRDTVFPQEMKVDYVRVYARPT